MRTRLYQPAPRWVVVSLIVVWAPSAVVAHDLPSFGTCGFLQTFGIPAVDWTRSQQLTDAACPTTGAAVDAPTAIDGSPPGVDCREGLTAGVFDLVSVISAWSPVRGAEEMNPTPGDSAPGEVHSGENRSEFAAAGPGGELEVAHNYCNPRWEPWQEDPTAPPAEDPLVAQATTPIARSSGWEQALSACTAADSFGGAFWRYGDMEILPPSVVRSGSHDWRAGLSYRGLNRLDHLRPEDAPRILADNWPITDRTVAGPNLEAWVAAAGQYAQQIAEEFRCWQSSGRLARWAERWGQVCLESRQRALDQALRTSLASADAIHSEAVSRDPAARPLFVICQLDGKEFLMPVNEYRQWNCVPEAGQGETSGIASRTGRGRLSHNSRDGAQATEATVPARQQLLLEVSDRLAAIAERLRQLADQLAESETASAQVARQRSIEER